MILRIIIAILILTVFSFLIKWCLSKLSFFKSRKILLHIVSGFIAIMLFIIYTVVFSYYITRIPQEKFNETVWVNNLEERHKMIDDLLKSDYLIGKNTEKIQEVFGKPKKVNSDKNIITYELIGQTALDFKITILKLYMNDNIVQKFTYDTKID